MAAETEHLTAVLTGAADRQLDRLFETFVSQLAAGTDRTEAAQHFANGLAIIKEALRAALYVVNAKEALRAALDVVNAMDTIAGGNHAEDGARYDNNPRS